MIPSRQRAKHAWGDLGRSLGRTLSGRPYLGKVGPRGAMRETLGIWKEPCALGAHPCAKGARCGCLAVSAERSLHPSDYMLPSRLASPAGPAGPVRQFGGTTTRPSSSAGALRAAKLPPAHLRHYSVTGISGV